jgi:hypothetical protein
MPHAHIVTDIDERLWLKQTPNNRAEFDGVQFTFGLDIAPNADVLIVYTRASWSIPTQLPKAKIIFIAGEPDDIHPYSSAFLNQFGTVVASSSKPLTTDRLDHSGCLIWFAGVDFDNLDAALGYDHFKALQSPPKDDKISIVTSSKSSTEYHKKRLAFIEVLKDRIPDHIELYGRGSNPISDKMNALLPHKYHLALENGAGRYSWTEKLSDPLLCWALPFYIGCENVEDELPADSIVRLDWNNPDQAINKMMKAREADLWLDRQDTLRKTRHMIMDDFNIMNLCAKLTKRAMKAPAQHAEKRLIRSEKSLWPEAGARGSIPETLLRSALLKLDPAIELKLARYRHARRS